MQVESWADGLQTCSPSVLLACRAELTGFCGSKQCCRCSMPAYCSSISTTVGATQGSAAAQTAMQGSLPCICHTV